MSPRYSQFSSFQTFLKPTRTKALLSAAAGTAVMLMGLPARGQTMSPITLSGFNVDIIAENSPAANYTNAGFDAFNNQDYYVAGYPGSTVGGLPANGTIVSMSNSSTTFQLGNFAANNALELNVGGATNTYAPFVSSGTLSLSSPNAFTKLSFLSAATNNKASDIVTATLTFADGSTYSDATTTDANTTSFAGQDWFNGTTGIAIESLSRVSVGTGVPDAGDGTNPRLYENDITLPSADQTKILTSVTLSTSGTGYAWALYAMSGAANGNGIGTIIWNGNVNSSLDTTTPNFQGSVAFTQYNAVQFDDSASGTTNVSIASAVVPSSVTFNNNQKPYTIGGAAFNASGALAVTGGGTVLLNNTDSFPLGTNVSSGTLTIGATGSLTTSALTVASGATFNISSGGQIAGSGGLPIALTGSGAINLAATTLNAGATTNFNGTLAGSGVLNLSAGTVTVSSPSALALTGGVTIGSTATSTASLIINDNSGSAGTTGLGPITVTLAGTGPGGLSSSVPSTSAGSIAGALKGADNAQSTFAGNIVITTVGATISGGSAGTLTLTGKISGSGPVVLGSDGGSTTILTASNTYTGQTTFGGDGNIFDAATLQLGHNNALGSGGLSLTAAAGPATLDLHGFNQTVAYLTAGGNTSVVTNLSSTPSVLTINGTSGATVFGSPINDGQAPISLVKSGANAQTLTATNAYSGGTNISGGVLTAAAPQALGTGPVLLSGGTLNLSVGAGNLTGFGSMVLNGGASVTNNVLKLTDGGGSEGRSAFTSTPAIFLANSGFTATFGYTPTSGADGVTFTIQNDSRGNAAVGGNGGGLGYGPVNGGTQIGNSVALEFNIYNGGGIGLGTNGTISDTTAPYNFSATPEVELFMGDPFIVSVNYNASAQTLVETITDTSITPSTNITNTGTYTYTGINLNSLLGGNLGYVGFTGATGGVTSTQTISNFNFSDGGLTSPTSIANNISTAAGTSSVLSASVVTGLTSATIGTLTVTAGSSLMVTSTASTANTRLVLTTPSLSIAGITNAWTGKLDLTTTALDVQNGSLATITNQVKQGFAGGSWLGSAGITSSTAAADSTHLTALGVIVNNDGNGNQLYGTGQTLGLFDGANPGSIDVLIKYTYYGDTNLNGTVDGSDYSRIDSAYTTDKATPGTLTGWFNGDFNYDGVIDGSDYTLIDNAFNQQGVSLAATVATATAQVAAVPEPATLSLTAIAAVGLLGRRPRRSA